MINKKSSTYVLGKYHRGFTLIELVIVIIILGILSATVVPKFFTSNGFTEYAYRTDVIAKLRLIQTRAMQQANNSCHQIMISTDKIGKVTCDTTPPVYIEKKATLVIIDNNDRVTFSPAGLTFSFDSLGRPKGCNQPCEISILGDQELKVSIEAEGYIHAL